MGRTKQERSKRVGWFARIVGWIAFAAAFAGAFYYFRTLREGSAPAGAELDALIDQAFTQVEVQIAPTLPKKINDYTTQTGLSHKGRVITYTYQLTFTKADLEAEPRYFSRMEANAAKGACDEKEVLRNLNDDVTMRYVYEDSRGNFLGEFEVTKGDC